jgi:hypothetical protein
MARRQPFRAACHQDAYCLASKVSLLTYRASNARLKAAAAPALSITIKSLSWHSRPDAEKFAAPVRSRPAEKWGKPNGDEPVAARLGHNVAPLR